jgi:GNAT superfamily N-acetyltransferase
MIDLSDDKARLDIARVHGWLTGSYWAPGIGRDQVEKQIAHAHCVGAYEQGEQIGFARAITDYASFAWIDDVWVDEGSRGRGVAQAMVSFFIEHADFATVRRFALVTADAHGVYAKVGFQPPVRPARWMERLEPEFEARVRASAS